MKTLFIFSFAYLLSALAMGQTSGGFHQFRVKNIHGDSIALSEFAGKKLLVVNTASFCGYTHQFTKLRKLDSTYQHLGFRVIGFPSNDFGGQDPYSDSVINSFCLNQYAISFPMMSKVSIRVGDTAEVYKWLQKKSRNGVANVSVAWNFNKFLIDAQGNWVRYFPSQVEPNDTAITNWIVQGSTTSREPVLPGLRFSMQSTGAGTWQLDFNWKTSTAGLWQVFSTEGRLLAQGDIPEGSEGLRLDLPVSGQRPVLFRLQSGTLRETRFLPTY